MERAGNGGHSREGNVLNEAKEVGTRAADETSPNEAEVRAEVTWRRQAVSEVTGESGF